MNSRAITAWFAVGHLAIDWPIAALWLIVPAAGLAMGLSPTQVGLLFTLFSIGGALAYIPAGILADRVSDRGRLLLVTFWWVAVGYGLAALSTGFWSLAILLAIAGMGNAAWHPIATGVLTRDKKHGRAAALGVHAIGGSAAEVLAPLSVGLLLSVFDWRVALTISIVPTVIAGICFVRVARAVPLVEKTTVNERDFGDLVRAWRTGRGLRIVAMICFYNMALIALLSMIPLYLVSAHGLTPQAIGLIFSLLLITGALAQPWAGALSDASGRGPILLIGTGTAAAAVAVVAFDPPFWVMISMMAIGVGTLDAIRAVMLAAAVDHSDRSEGTTLGLAFVLMDGVGAVGAVLAGMAAAISWELMFGLACIFSAAAAFLSLSLLSENSIGKLPKCLNFLPVWRDRQRLRKDLKDRLTRSPHLISDIGMTHKEAEMEIAKWFWQE